MSNTTFSQLSSLETLTNLFKKKEVRHPALVKPHLDDPPPGRVQQQQAGQRGEGHAGRHQYHIFRYGIIWPITRCVQLYMFTIYNNFEIETILC